jgi:phage/conjugal plasmid C-4 type zinc finger TraR family protein
MPDWIDNAVEQEQADLERSLHEVTARLPRGESAKWCEGAGCGERIPDARRKAVPGVKLCIQCQGRHDQKSRQFVNR